MYENNNRQYDFLDIISVLSFVLAIENLKENREQSDHNDVSKANQKQADYLLKQVKSLFEEQNRVLQEILDRLNA